MTSYRWAAVAVAGLLAGAAPANVERATVVGSAAVVMEHCDYCNTWDSGLGILHTFHDADEMNRKCVSTEDGGCHQDERGLYCSGKHSQCPDNFALVESVEEFVKEQNAAELRKLIAEGSSILYSAEREAVQVLGCSGGIAAHFPVGNRLAKALAD